MAKVEEQRASAAPTAPAWIWLAASNTVLSIAAIVVAVLLGRSSVDLQRQQAAAVQELDRRLTEQQERLASLDEKSTFLASLVASAPAADARSGEMQQTATTSLKPAAAAGESPVPVDASRDRVIAELVGSVVLITALDDAGNEIGAGSGFVVGADGLVATNYHVLAQAAKATAKFRDDTVCKIAGARAFAVDADLAIVQLENPPPGLRALKLAGEESPAPGSDAIAIGHPGGFEFSTTAGVVSAIHATADLPARYRKQIDAPADQVWVQTTAVIAGGSSGGPLLNAQGEVLGVNTWLAAGEKLGFAAHVKHLRPLLDDLLPDPTPLAEMTGPDAAIDRLVQEFLQDQTWFASRMETAASDEERQELEKTRNPAGKFAHRFLALAGRHRETPSALKALKVVCELAGYDDSDRGGEWLGRACDQLLEDHAENPALPQFAVLVSNSPHKAAARRFLQRAADLPNNQTAAGLSCYLLASSLAQDAQCQQADRDVAKALFERVVRDFGDLQFSGAAVGKLAERELDVLMRLSVGCQAPEIAGQDGDEQEFKLSEFRGKVILLDFWADWCPHCVRMYPHERQLVETYAGQPFVLLGVNNDDRETLREVQASKQVTWRSWSDGRGGPIVRDWRVDGFPTMFLIDHTGKIRFKWNGFVGEEIDEAVKQLVEEAKAAAEKSPPPAEAEASSE